MRGETATAERPCHGGTARAAGVGKQFGPFKARRRAAGSASELELSSGCRRFRVGPGGDILTNSIADVLHNQTGKNLAPFVRSPRWRLASGPMRTIRWSQKHSELSRCLRRQHHGHSLSPARPGDRGFAERARREANQRRGPDGAQAPGCRRPTPVRAI
jgi:hypothetical protein